MDWQPIETAPKDGTEVLTFQNGRQYVRCYGEDDDGDPNWIPRVRGGTPTHWMPLPSPPDAEVSS